MVVKILIGVAAVLVLFIVVVAMRRSDYHVERKLELAVPADRVFNVLNDLQQFSRVFVLFGAPLEKRDPNMQKTFEGPTGVGQSFAWSGKEAGKGKMTIAESVPGQKVNMRLEFVEPMASTASCALTVAASPAGSSVTWSMDGKHNFLGRALGVFVDMDNMLGADIEKSLAELRTVAESPLASAPAPR